MTEPFEVRIDPPVGLVIDAVADIINPTIRDATLLAANHAGGIIATVVTRTFKGTGDLARSFLPAHFVKGKSGNVTGAAATSDKPQARILDQGGTIRPKTAKALAIPITPHAKNLWPREWPQEKLSLVVNKKTGKALLAETVGEGKSAKLIYHYVLLKKAEITGRHYLDEARKKAVPIVSKIMADAIEKAAKEAARDA